jgi:hypothetical protein
MPQRSAGAAVRPRPCPRRPGGPRDATGRSGAAAPRLGMPPRPPAAVRQHGGPARQHVPSHRPTAANPAYVPPLQQNARAQAAAPPPAARTGLARREETPRRVHAAHLPRPLAGGAAVPGPARRRRLPRLGVVRRRGRRDRLARGRRRPPALVRVRAPPCPAHASPRRRRAPLGARRAGAPRRRAGRVRPPRRGARPRAGRADAAADPRLGPRRDRLVVREEAPRRPLPPRALGPARPRPVPPARGRPLQPRTHGTGPAGRARRGGRRTPGRAGRAQHRRHDDPDLLPPVPRPAGARGRRDRPRQHDLHHAAEHHPGGWPAARRAGPCWCRCSGSPSGSGPWSGR